MKFLKEFTFRCLIVLVMSSLAFVGWDLSQPIIATEKQLNYGDVLEVISQTFSAITDDKAEEIGGVQAQGFSFTLNILIPIIIYMVSIGGFLYLLFEDYKLLMTFTRYNKLAKLFWVLWLIILAVLVLLPIFFGMKLFAKSFLLAVLATAIFLVIIAILYRLSCKIKNTR